MNDPFAVDRLTRIINAKHLALKRYGLVCFSDQAAERQAQNGTIQSFVSRTRIRNRALHDKAGGNQFAPIDPNWRNQGS